MSDEERAREIAWEFADKTFSGADRKREWLMEQIVAALKAKEREVLEREEMDSIIKTIKYMYQEISMGTGYRIGSGATLIWLSRLEEALAAFTRMKDRTVE